MQEHRRSRRRPVAEINVVPYIDVMLVLLIIFMVTAPLITQGVNVELPQADAQPLDQETKPPLVASVDSEGLFYLNLGAESKSTPLAPDDLVVLVAAHLLEAPGTPVMVNGDKSVPYEDIIKLMVLLQGAGVPSVGLMTDPFDS